MGYVEFLESMNKLDFLKHLRVTRTSFGKILYEINVQLGEKPRGRDLPHGTELALWFTLWYLGSQITYREIGKKIGISEGTVHLCVQRVIDALVNIRTKYIAWPSEEHCRTIEEEFRKFAGFRGVVGAVDECHVRIKAPSLQQSDYLNRKFEHSVNVLAVASANLKFIYVYAGFPGRAHDSRVLQNTSFWMDIMNGQEQKYFPSEQYHILGDSAFPLHTHLLVPFKTVGNVLQSHQQKYNQILSKTRVVIENAFGFLKGKI